MRAIVAPAAVAVLAGLMALSVARAQQVSDSPSVIRCESRDGRWSHCAIDTRGRVELIRQVSRAPCLRNQSWGIDKTGIWATSGCRADFSVGAASARDGQAPQIVRCESEDGRKLRCPVKTRGGVRVARQLSRTECVEGQTWGITRNTIWVTGGCRADFEVIRSERDWRWWRSDN